MKSKPVPESATVAGVATAAELTVSAPVAEPPALGGKTTEAVQLAPAARLPVQVFCAMLNGAVAASATEPMAVAGGVGDGDRLRRAGLARGDHGKGEHARDWWRGRSPCTPEPLSGTETAATPAVEEETTSVAAMEPVAWE